jgi:ribosomal protein S18 acetylase RimI-like enzyme
MIVSDGTAAGAMIVARTEREIRLVDIALLPDYRGAGLGGVLLNRLQVEARTTGRPLRLSVHQSNRARRLYERLGFSPVGMTADYIRMEWRAP